MPINEQVINNLLDNATPSSSSNRVYFVEPGNMMTAMSYFKRITGQQLGLDALSLHAIGGLGRKQAGISLDGLLQRSIASASAYAHGDIVLATQTVLNSGAGQAALRNMQQLGF